MTSVMIHGKIKSNDETRDVLLFFQLTILLMISPFSLTSIYEKKAQLIDYIANAQRCDKKMKKCSWTVSQQVDENSFYHHL